MKLQVIADNSPPSIEVVHGRTTPRSERDKAFAYWAWGCRRNIKLAAERLGIDRKTIYAWMRQDDWHLRYEQEIADTSPHSQRMLAFAHLGNSAYEAARVVSEIKGATAETYAERFIEAVHTLAPDDFPVSDEQLMRCLVPLFAGNHHMSKVRLTAAQDILNRCGITAEVGMRMVIATRQAVDETPVQDLTDEELFDQL